MKTTPSRLVICPRVFVCLFVWLSRSTTPRSDLLAPKQRSNRASKHASSSSSEREKQPTTNTRKSESAKERARERQNVSSGPTLRYVPRSSWNTLFAEVIGAFFRAIRLLAFDRSHLSPPLDTRDAWPQEAIGPQAAELLDLHLQGLEAGSPSRSRPCRCWTTLRTITFVVSAPRYACPLSLWTYSSCSRSCPEPSRWRHRF